MTDSASAEKAVVRAEGDPSSGGIVAMTCLEDWLFAAVDKVLEQWDLSVKPRSRITQSY